MSLRDQLLKQGLVNKQQAKKAEKKAKKDRHKKAKGAEVESDQLKKEIARKKQEQREKDLQLNKEREQERLKRERSLQAMETIMSHDQKEFSRKADQTYYFIEDKIQIRSMEVTEVQVQKLAEGKFSIASIGDDNFYLLNEEDTLKINQLWPEFLICWHNTPEPAEKKEPTQQEVDS